MIKKLTLALILLSLFNGLCNAAYAEIMDDVQGTRWTLYGTKKIRAAQTRLHV